MIKKITFKSTLTFSEPSSKEIAVNFKSFNGEGSFDKFTITFNPLLQIFYGGDYISAYSTEDDGTAYWDTDANVIEIDTNQPNYNQLITAMTGNIEAIEDIGINKLKIGSETPTKLYLGSTEVTKAYLGDTLVYQK